MKTTILLILGVIALAIAGCETITPPPEEPQLKDPTGGGVIEPPQPTVGTEPKMVEIAPMNLYLNSNEVLMLRSGKEETSIAQSTIEEELSGKLLNIISNIQDADLVINITGTSKLNEKFGEFYSFDAVERVKVLNPVNGDTIDSKSFSARGDRELNETDAAESALKKAATEASDHIVTALTNKSSYCLSTNLVIENIPDNHMAQQLRTILQDNEWINRVDLKSYDAVKRLAIYEIRYAALERGNISHKLYGIKGFKVVVVRYDNKNIYAYRVGR